MGSLTLGVVLVVRLYDSSGLSDLDRAAVTAVAGQILSAASVPTSWPACSGTQPTSPPRPRLTSLNDSLNPAAFICSRPMDAGEIAVRIVRGSDSARHPHGSARTDRQSLGYALVDRERGTGALATVYRDRLEHLAADAGVRWQTLMGRAIAHEIGHLLLGDNSHARGGLMRAIWSRHMLQHDDATEWLFTTQQALAIREAVDKTRTSQGEMAGLVGSPVAGSLVARPAIP